VCTVLYSKRFREMRPMMTRAVESSTVLYRYLYSTGIIPTEALVAKTHDDAH
jgi:hypothetical protein